MMNNVHKHVLKYGALFGLVPYLTPTGQQNYNIKNSLQNHPLYPPNSQHIKEHHQYLHSYKSNNHIKVLRWQKIYTILLIVANLMVTLYGVIFLQFEGNFFISNLVSIIVFVAQVITVISMLLETMFKYEKYYELIYNYNRVELLMKQLLQTQLCVLQIRKRHYRKYALAILAIYGSLLASILIIGIKTYNGYFWYAFIAIVILRSRSIQMTICLDYIIYFLEAFNVKLKALISCKIAKNYKILDIDYNYLESFDYLQNLKSIYMEIYDLHEKYNELFGHSLATLYTVVVLDIIINIYWTLLTLFEYYESYYNYITCSTLVPLFAILFMLCYTAEQCEQQCLQTLISLKQLLRSATFSSTSSTDNECYNSLLQSFILQILQNPLTVSANGYFTVNLKTLMKILAIIVTNLVILLQFRKTNVSEETTNVTDDYSNSSDVNMIEACC